MLTNTQPVPHIEQLSSRLLLLSLLPILHTFVSPLTPSPPPLPPFRRTVLDVGAGIGRVTNNVLLPLFDDVVLVEPVPKFVGEAVQHAKAGQWRDLPSSSAEKADEKNGLMGGDDRSPRRGKRVWFVKGGLQGLDPRFPTRRGDDLGVVSSGDIEGESDGFGDPTRAEGVCYDVSVMSAATVTRAAFRADDSIQHLVPMVSR